jgi:hypothetical protein
MSNQLANVLGFKPLDRLQLNSMATIAELSIDRRLYGIRNPELPFLYFQRILLDGRIEARSPGGSVVNVEVTDVCDVIPGEPVLVRAMTRMGLRNRLALSAKEQQTPPEASCYHSAYVLWVAKNRWNQVEPRVWFVDEGLNTEAFNSPHFIAPIHLDDRTRLEKAAKRTVMPVVNYRTASNSSADHGVRSATDFAKDVAAGFIKLAVAGRSEAAAVLASHGAAPVSRAKLNKLISI